MKLFKIIFLMVIISSCAQDIRTLKTTFLGNKIKERNFNIDTLDKYYNISKVINIKSPSGFHTIFDYQTAHYYNFNDSLHFLISKTKLLDTNLIQNCCDNSAVIATAGRNKCSYYANLSWGNISRLYELDDYLYYPTEINNDNYKVYKDDYSLNRIYYFYKEKIIFVEQKGFYLRIITIGVEYRKYLPYIIGNFISDHHSDGGNYINNTIKEYLFDKDLNLVSVIETEYDYIYEPIDYRKYEKMRQMHSK